MSLFLGKIHYWLFNKIQWFEGLEKEVLDFAKSQENLPVKTWEKEIYHKYGKPLPNKPLEEMIDTSNIHGWLQNQISRAEGRQAAWVTRILNASKEYEKDLINIFRKQGEKLGESYKENFIPQTPQEMNTVLNDFILEGMPCDRVNEELESNDKLYSWITTTCLHTPHWQSEGGDINNFYNLREVWIKSFIKALNENFVYDVSIVNGKRVHDIKKIS